MTVTLRMPAPSDEPLISGENAETNGMVAETFALSGTQEIHWPAYNSAPFLRPVTGTVTSTGEVNTMAFAWMVASTPLVRMAVRSFMRPPSASIEGLTIGNVM